MTKNEIIGTLKERKDQAYQYMVDRGDVPDDVRGWDLQDDQNSIWDDGYARGLEEAIDLIGHLKA
ncbi:MAG: hypothetical protein WC455_10495 [Dehalococcoidia bacterium]|jgi:hypothetical protein